MTFFMRTPPSFAAATLNEDRMCGRRSRRSELKPIRGANSFYSVQLCDIDCVYYRNATALRRRHLTRTNPRYLQFHRGSCWQFQRGVTCWLQLLLLRFVMLRHAGFSRREPAMMAYVVSEGRLLSLKPFEWLMLLVGGMLCGSLTLLF